MRSSLWSHFVNGETRLYVVKVEDAAPEQDVYTISDRPDMPGWETDSGCDGYGLSYYVAKCIVENWNSGLTATKE